MSCPIAVVRRGVSQPHGIEEPIEAIDYHVSIGESRSYLAQ